MPLLVLVAGPNGSGKTTLVRSGILSELLQPDMTMINADDIARGLAGGAEPSPAHSLQAAQMGDDALDACIAAGQSVLMETVLSSDKLQRRVEAARANGFIVALIYVTLHDGAQNVARVGQRHRQGGHSVPADLILARRHRSHVMFTWFARVADTVLVFDNTELGAPSYVAGKSRERWSLRDLDRLPTDLAGAIRALAAPQGA